MFEMNADEKFLTVEELKVCKNINILNENIEIRRMLINNMVGNLYPAILEGEILDIKEIIRSL